MKILIADDDQMVRDTLEDYLGGLLGYDLTLCENGKKALEVYNKEFHSIVLTDIRMPGMSGMELLKEIKKTETGSRTKVIIFTGHAELETAVDAVRNGAYDYLFKPIDISRLTDLIEICKKEPAVSSDKSPGGASSVIPATPAYVREIITLPKAGAVAVYSEAFSDSVKIALTYHKERDIPVLIEGESGTGKEIIAELIHSGADSEGRPFITVNCPAISTSLFESELFGYESGAFTGASKFGKKGILESAGGGTVFLDEIGELIPENQAKLLRAIQTREIIKVGGKTGVKLDIRYIAASNRNLKLEVESGRFRSDLYHRLDAGKITLKPLREQKNSMAGLALFFLKAASAKRGKRFSAVGDDALELLTAYNWPGNVRELRNAVEKAVVLFDDTFLRASHLSFIELPENLRINSGKPVLRQGEFSLPEEGLDLKQIEKEIVEKALAKFEGKKADTARYLGLSYSALRSRLD